MDDRIEKYIKSHRADLDDKVPRNDLWSDIESELGSGARKRSISTPVIYWRAAAVILLLVSSWLVFDKVSQNGAENGSAVVELSPQLLDAETYYISLIDQKREEIKTLGDKFDMGSDFLYEIDRLDSMYSVLKQDMANGNEENLADAMILNLQLRIEILNQQLSIIQSIENSQQDETIIL